jgi:flagellar biosynthetic protein FliQ
MDAFDGLLREALVVIVVLAIPILALATTVGTLVALVQAATQIQEQTLTLLPKVVAVAIALAVFGGFGMHLCAALFLEAIARLPAIVAGS